MPTAAAFTRSASATRVLLHVLIGLLVLVLAGGASAQELDELLRSRVEQLRQTGELDADGAAIAAKTLIPRLYEARAFALEWHSTAQIDSLLEAIDESYLEGLDHKFHAHQIRKKITL